MSITGIILAAVVVGGTGLFIGLFLGFAGNKFAVGGYGGIYAEMYEGDFVGVQAYGDAESGVL